jgi:hypothetical protein
MFISHPVRRLYPNLFVSILDVNEPEAIIIRFGVSDLELLDVGARYVRNRWLEDQINVAPHRCLHTDCSLRQRTEQAF